MQDYTTILKEGVIMGDLNKVKYAVENGVDLNEDMSNGLMDSTAYGYKILHWAARYNRVEIIQYLAKHNIEIEQRNIISNTPLHVAIFYGQFEAAKSLLEHKADPNCKNRAGYTPLYKGGNTPLHYAIHYSNALMVSLLLQYGADIHVINDEGNTPLQEAQILLNQKPEEAERLRNIISTLNSNTEFSNETRTSISDDSDEFFEETQIIETPAPISQTVPIFKSADPDKQNYAPISPSDKALSFERLLRIAEGQSPEKITTTDKKEAEVETILPVHKTKEDTVGLDDELVRRIYDGIAENTIKATQYNTYNTYCSAVDESDKLVNLELKALIGDSLSEAEIIGRIEALLSRMNNSGRNELRTKFTLDVVLEAKRSQATVSRTTNPHLNFLSNQTPAELMSKNGIYKLEKVNHPDRGINHDLQQEKTEQKPTR